MSSNKTRWALVGAGIALLSSTSVLVVEFPPFTKASAAPASEAAVPATPVTVSTVAQRKVTEWEEFSGRLEAVDRIQIRSRVSGEIQAVHFREGALVKQGDLLFKIDPAPYEAVVAQAEGQVASAEARLDLAKTELDRGRRLSESKTISQSDMDQRSSALTGAKAGLRSAEASLRSAQLDLNYTEVRAPVSGRVGKIDITAGNLVAAGSASAALTTLVSVDPIYASFNASEGLVSKALAALPQTDEALPALEQIPVEVGTLADEGTPIKGTLQLVDNQVDAASGTIGVRAVFDNPGGKLIPGQFVRVRMGQPKATERLTISERAIGTDQDKKFVFVVDGENKVSYRPVQLGPIVDGDRVIEGGLAAGDRIVVNGLQRIRPGAVVAPQEEEKVATAQ